MRMITGTRRSSYGFTLVELVITIALLALLLGLALPSFLTMISNTRVRSVSEALQNGVRTAQAEALRRNRQVVFFLTNAEPSLNAAAATNGRFWGIQTVPQAANADETAEFVQGGALSDLTGAVAVAGPASICFNSAGRLANNAAPGVPGANCSTAVAPAYNISANGSDRALRVTVALGGQTRMCDPARTFSSTSPKGC